MKFDLGHVPRWLWLASAGVLGLFALEFWRAGETTIALAHVAAAELFGYYYATRPRPPRWQSRPTRMQTIIKECVARRIIRKL